jgi:GNAT superfamily N-acetyltransferase
MFTEEKLIETLERQSWKFAHTMPYLPHWHVWIDRWTSQEDMDYCVAAITALGQWEFHFKEPHHYFYANGWRYWWMNGRDGTPIVINRERETERPANPLPPPKPMATDSYEIREVRWDDIEWIPRTYDTGGASFSQHKGRHWWLAYFERPQSLVAVTKTLKVSRRRARVCSIWVKPGRRGEGIGKTLLGAQLDHALQHGFSVIDAISESSMFERAGFVEVGAYRAGKKWERNL